MAGVRCRGGGARRSGNGFQSARIVLVLRARHHHRRLRNLLSGDQATTTQLGGGTGTGDRRARRHRCRRAGQRRACTHRCDSRSAAEFELQWKAAQSAIAAHDTEEKATALGYVRATAPSGGIGTHWVLWSQIAKPFDPATPSMLLFDERRNPAVLVGYSYALQSPIVPVGFAGPNDHWHQHRGLCVVGGWVEREQAPGPDACEGTYIAGGDFWMLHAWVVPGWDNRKGDFAPF